MALLSFDNAKSIDLGIYIAAIIFYVIIVWIPVITSLILVKTYEPVSMSEFKFRWWKFKRQYIYIEIWFRTHVILGCSLLIIIIAEPGWGIVVYILAPIFIITICIILYKVSQLVHQRIPGDIQIKSEFTQHMKYHKTSRGDMRQFMGDIGSTSGVVDSQRRTDKTISHDELPEGPQDTLKKTQSKDYQQTNSTTEDTMKKQLELGQTSNDRDGDGDGDEDDEQQPGQT